jgi:hypothetical protein
MPNCCLDIKILKWHHVNVRTTLSLDDDLMRLVRRYAESRSLGLGKAVSELVRRGFSTERPTRVVGGLRVFDLPPDSPKVTTQSIRDLEFEDE